MKRMKTILCQTPSNRYNPISIFYLVCKIVINMVRQYKYQIKKCMIDIWITKMYDWFKLSMNSKMWQIQNVIFMIDSNDLWIKKYESVW